MSKLKDRPKRKKRKKQANLTKCFTDFGGVACMRIPKSRKKRTKKTKINLEKANQNTAGARRARLREQQEKEKKKTIPKLSTKKLKTIPVDTGEKKIIKKKPPVKKIIKKKPPVKKVVYKGNSSKVKSTPTKGFVAKKGTLKKTPTNKPKPKVTKREPYTGKGDPAVWIKKQGWEVNADTLKKAMDSKNKYLDQKAREKQRCGPKGCR
tara:strand:+ start:552 stop:1175 length:624 start_codon:yes stop_codon:yes gene_type:complete